MISKIVNEHSFMNIFMDIFPLMLRIWDYFSTTQTVHVFLYFFFWRFRVYYGIIDLEALFGVAFNKNHCPYVNTDIQCS